MDDRCGLIKESASMWKTLRDGDFEEEEIWDVLNGRERSNFVEEKRTEPSVYVPRYIPAAARMIPRNNGSNMNNHNNCSREDKIVQQSAPVNIPTWSKMHRSKRSARNSMDAVASMEFLDEDDNGGGGSHDEDDRDFENENCMMPPHEFISRRLARSQVSSFSVVEGAGRTLKGRDLSKMRNAILTRTGFLES